MMQPNQGRSEAAAVIWDWRGRKSADGSMDRARAIRIRGTTQALVGATAGGLIFHFVSPTVGTIVLTISGVILASALLSPKGLFSAIERLFVSLGLGIGRVFTWILLPLIFYLVFLPFGLLLRRGRRDSMKRFYEPDADSYWSQRDGVTTASASRDRQY